MGATKRQVEPEVEPEGSDSAESFECGGGSPLAPCWACGVELPRGAEVGSISCGRCGKNAACLTCVVVRCVDCSCALCPNCTVLAAECSCNRALCGGEACTGACDRCDAPTCASCSIRVYEQRDTTRRCLSCLRSDSRTAPMGAAPVRDSVPAPVSPCPSSPATPPGNEPINRIWSFDEDMVCPGPPSKKRRRRSLTPCSSDDSDAHAPPALVNPPPASPLAPASPPPPASPQPPASPSRRGALSTPLRSRGLAVTTPLRSRAGIVAATPPPRPAQRRNSLTQRSSQLALAASGGDGASKKSLGYDGDTESPVSERLLPQAARARDASL